MCIRDSSKYYYFVFWFSVTSAILAVILNYVLIQSHGIIGAAFATLVVILFVNFCKIILVHYLFKIHPYSRKTLGVLLSLAMIYAFIYVIPSTLNPWLSIPLRSLLIFGLFSVPLFVFRWSTEIYGLIKDVQKRLF